MEEQGLTVSINDDTVDFNQVIEAILRFDKDICHKYMFIPYLDSVVIDNDIHIYCKSDDELGTLIIGTSSLIRNQGFKCAELKVIITNPLTGLDFEYDVGSVLLFNNWNNEDVKNQLDRIYTFRDVQNDYMVSRNNGALNRINNRYMRKKCIDMQLATRLHMYMEDDVKVNDKFGLKILDIDDPDIAIIALPTSHIKKNGEIVSHYVIQKTFDFESNYPDTGSDKLLEVYYNIYKVILENEDDKEYKQVYINADTAFRERYGAYSITGSIYSIVVPVTYKNLYTKNGVVKYSNSKSITILEPNNMREKVNYYDIFKYIVKDLENE